MHMVRKCLLAVLLSCCLVFPQFDDTDIDIANPNELVTLFKKRFLSYRTYETDFKELNGSNLKQGKIFFKKPNLIRIKYFKGDEMVTDIFSDKEKLYIYFVKRGIIFEQDIDPNDKNDATAATTTAASLDAYYLVKNYDFNFKVNQNLNQVFSPEERSKFLILNQSARNLAYHLVLTPKSVEAGLNGLELWLSANGDVIRFKSSGLSRSVVDFYFFNVKINETLIADSFNFVIPNQVRVVKNILPTD